MLMDTNIGKQTTAIKLMSTKIVMYKKKPNAQISLGTR
jgi:hypothetical protein